MVILNQEEAGNVVVIKKSDDIVIIKDSEGNEIYRDSKVTEKADTFLDSLLKKDEEWQI